MMEKVVTRHLRKDYMKLVLRAWRYRLKTIKTLSHEIH